MFHAWVAYTPLLGADKISSGCLSAENDINVHAMKAGIDAWQEQTIMLPADHMAARDANRGLDPIVRPPTHKTAGLLGGIQGMQSSIQPFRDNFMSTSPVDSIAWSAPHLPAAECGGSVQSWGSSVMVSSNV